MTVTRHWYQVTMSGASSFRSGLLRRYLFRNTIEIEKTLHHKVGNILIIRARYQGSPILHRLSHRPIGRSL